MADLVYVVVIAAFFGLAVLFVYACDRIIGPDPEPDPMASDADNGRDPAKVVVEVGS
jgi:hypothetical protein